MHKEIFSMNFLCSMTINILSMKLVIISVQLSCSFFSTEVMNHIMYISDFTCLCGNSTLWRSWGWSYYSDTWCERLVQSWWEKAGHRWEDFHPHFHWTQLGTLGICFFCLPSYVWQEIREGNTSIQSSSHIRIFCSLGMYHRVSFTYMIGYQERNIWKLWICTFDYPQMRRESG